MPSRHTNSQDHARFNFLAGPNVGAYRACQFAPGGCDIGRGPVDLHLSALEKWARGIATSHGYIEARAPKDGG